MIISFAIHSIYTTSGTLYTAYRAADYNEATGKHRLGCPSGTAMTIPDAIQELLEDLIHYELSIQYPDQHVDTWI